MIDLHAHVLPALDDGAATSEESLAMLRLAVLDGTRTLCATPHAHGPQYDVSGGAALAAHAALREAVRTAGIDIDLRLASEVWYRPDLDALARAGRLAYLGSGAYRYALIEFAPTHVPLDAAEVLFRLRLEGVTPIVAHPERNPSFWANPDAAVRLRQGGALLQVTAGSLTGLFRKESRACAKALFDREAVDLLASDCHHADRRPPGMAAAARVVAKWVGPSQAERVTEAVPRAILAGLRVPGAVA